MIIQGVIILFIIYALASAFVRFRKKQVSGRELVFWSLLWVIAGVVVLLPQTTSFLASKVGIGRGVDLVVYLSILLLFYMIFRIFIKLDRLDRDISGIVKKIAMSNAKKEKDV